MTTTIRSSADGSKSYIAVGGTDRVTIGSQGIEAGSYKPGSIAANDFADGALIENSANGVGYGPGAGGTVTQATSKSTAVTLNRPCGFITMNAASLAAGASVVFNLVSSCIADAADGVLVHGIWQAVTPASYRIEPVGYVAANTFAIRVTNITGAALAEAVCVGFVVIKGATS